jgi:hypothetical protein
MTWTAPSNVSTGNALTALLWNNQLGTSGSVRYLYDQLSGRQWENRQIFAKSTNTVFGGAGNVDVAWDTRLLYNAGSEKNFSSVVPVTTIPIPQEGMYNFTFQYRATVSTRIDIRFFMFDGGASTYLYQIHQTPTANILTQQSCMFYCNTNSTVKMNIQVALATTISYVAPSNTDGSQNLTICRVG